MKIGKVTPQQVISETELDGWLEPEYIPDSWVDDSGIRHVVIWYEDVEYEYIKEGDSYILKAKVPF